jgi:Pyruvate/2-oxoacid:ferredoxin oxidoreductase delta subunit
MGEKIPQEKSKKKRSKEDEYFAKEESQKIAKQRERLDQERVEAEKKHYREKCWMRCPKCGHELKETEHERVMIDMCPGCGGVWLDAGELEILRQNSSTGFMQGLIKSLTRSRT